MDVKYEDIKKANDAIKTTEIKGKDYAEVAQRIKAFRMIYPQGCITTHIHSIENGICVMYATCGYYDETGRLVVLGTGTAYEKEGATMINKTSYIENCETSAVGRALGMAGFGIDVSVASYEEIKTAILNQETEPERKATAKQIEMLSKVYTGENLTRLLTANGIEKIEDLPLAKASELISKLKGKN